MVECRVVSIKEIQEDNPTLCLSPLRFLNKCHKCEQYRKFTKGQIKQMKCKPHLDISLINAELQERKQFLLNQIEKIDAKIKTNTEQLQHI